jgi:hypothetical protein
MIVSTVRLLSHQPECRERQHADQQPGGAEQAASADAVGPAAADRQHDDHDGGRYHHCRQRALSRHFQRIGQIADDEHAVDIEGHALDIARAKAEDRVLGVGAEQFENRHRQRCCFSCCASVKAGVSMIRTGYRRR